MKPIKPIKPNVITSFAAGLLISGAVCGAAYLSEKTSSDDKVDKVEETKKAGAEISEEDMKNSLADSGYIILSNEEWERQLSLTAENEAEANEDEEVAQPEGETKEVIIYRTIVNVASGMTSIDVGNALAKGKIIDSGKTFFNEVEKRGLANKLKPGTYELESNMTMDEVISIIFK